MITWSCNDVSSLIGGSSSSKYWEHACGSTSFRWSKSQLCNSIKDSTAIVMVYEYITFTRSPAKTLLTRLRCLWRVVSALCNFGDGCQQSVGATCGIFFRCTDMVFKRWYRLGPLCLDYPALLVAVFSHCIEAQGNTCRGQFNGIQGKVRSSGHRVREDQSSFTADTRLHLENLRCNAMGGCHTSRQAGWI